MIETHGLKNVVIFIQIVSSFVVSWKIVYTFLLLSSVALTITFVIYGEGISPTESRDSLIMWSRDMKIKALSPPSIGHNFL